MVTHDPNLALKHARTIYCMKDGLIEKVTRKENHLKNTTENTTTKTNTKKSINPTKINPTKINPTKINPTRRIKTK